jgi:hypothetical protein
VKCYNCELLTNVGALVALFLVLFHIRIAKMKEKKRNYKENIREKTSKQE